MSIFASSQLPKLSVKNRITLLFLFIALLRLNWIYYTSDQNGIQYFFWGTVPRYIKALLRQGTVPRYVKASPRRGTVPKFD